MRDRDRRRDRHVLRPSGPRRAGRSRGRLRPPGGRSRRLRRPGRALRRRALPGGTAGAGDRGLRRRAERAPRPPPTGAPRRTRADRRVTAAVVIPNRNGADWLPGCLEGIAAQTVAPAEVVVVDNASSDRSPEAAARHPGVRVIALPTNLGFAAAANRGVAAVDADAVALVNTDVVVAPDWLERTTAALAADPGAGAVACKMVDLRRPELLYDAGNVLRRDGVCEQRGRFQPDDGRFDAPGEVFSACAGAALYRRSALVDVGGFDERLFIYLEDVDLGLRLRLAGWRCLYEPAVARHAGGGSSDQLSPPRAHLAAAARALPLLPAMLRERRRLRAGAALPVQEVVPRLPIRAPRASRSGLQERREAIQ
ncbi:MAG: glycosyltransferase family 2 protein [Actinobacteria bacterium]|nr:MAG: glycosyltransferase family 2 protein [Actinomycetota bacterium]